VDRPAAITGRITFKEGAPDLDGVAIHIFLENTTYADAAAVVVRHEVLDAKLTFELKDLAVEERALYTIRVLVDTNGDGKISRGDYINVVSYPVLTRGHPTDVTIQVEQVIARGSSAGR
jgi:hypothetical protein